MTKCIKLALAFALLFSAIVVYADFASPHTIGFFCSPYLRSFAEDHHYIPEGGTCTYEAPTLNSPAAKTLHIYKGTPGNATRLATHMFVAATHTQTADNFSTLAEEGDDLFVAIYQTSSIPAANQAFDAYFETGAGSPPNESYGILQFKYGPKPASEYDPVIVIPGILGSWQKNGKWVIDPVKHIYDDIIKTFKKNGYVENETLFPFPYNWRLSNKKNAENLKSKIKEVKDSCDCDRVDIVAHSMGGLVARSYAQGDDYQDDIDQIIFLGTPHLGAPKSYPLYENGEVVGEGILNWFLEQILTNEARRNNYDDIFDYVRHKPISSIQELLPIFDYLIDVPGGTRDYPTNYPKNSYLEDLASSVSNLTVNKIRYTNVIGSSDGTILGFEVEDAPDESPKWEHGKVTNIITGAGDGTVPRVSVENLFVADEEFETDHTSLPSNSDVQKYIFKTLNNKEPAAIVANDFYWPNAKILLIELFSPIDLLLTNEDGESSGTDPDTGEEVDEIDDAFYSGNDNDPEYLVITDPEEGEYSLEALGTDDGEYTIVASYITDEGITNTEITGNTNEGETDEIILSLSSGDEDILELSVQSATVSGSVFEDTDGNGERAEAAVPEDCEGGDFCAPEEVELGIADRSVTLSPIDEGGNPDDARAALSATTTESGNYELTLTSGDFGWWRIAEDVPSGWHETYPSAGYHDVYVQNGDALTEDADGNTLIFGNWEFATVTAKVWEDADEDGVYDEDESSLSGFAVALAFVKATDTPDTIDATLSAADVTDEEDVVSLAMNEPGRFVLLIEERSGFNDTHPKATTTTLLLAKGAGATSTNFLTSSFFLLGTSTSGASVTKDAENEEADGALQFGIYETPPEAPAPSPASSENGGASSGTQSSGSGASGGGGNGIPGSVGGGGISFAAPAAPPSPPPPPPAPAAAPQGVSATPLSATPVALAPAVSESASPPAAEEEETPQRVAAENSPATEASLERDDTPPAQNPVDQTASAVNAFDLPSWEWFATFFLLLSLGYIGYLLLVQRGSSRF